MGRPILLPPDVAEDLRNAEQAVLELNLRNPDVASPEGVAGLRAASYVGEPAGEEAIAGIAANSATELLLKALPSAPVVTVATAARLVQRSVPQTNAAVNRLAQAGVLIPIRDVQRNRAFEVAGLLDAITDFELALASTSGDTCDSPPVRRVLAPPSRGKAERPKSV